jgi:hypothetical protein
LFTNVFEVERYRQDYQAYLDLLVRYYFNQQGVGTQARQWARMLRPHLQSGAGDRMYFGPEAQSSLEEFDEGVRELIQLTVRRAQYVAGVLDAGQ